MNIQPLLTYLNSLFPVTPRFSITLAPLMSPQVSEHKEKLLIPPERAKYAWYLLSGIVIASVLGKSGKEIVLRIYWPSFIFTDLDSFLHGKFSTVTLTAINGAELQRIERQDFIEIMAPFAETQELKERIIFLDKEKDTERSILLDMPEEDRFNTFALTCPVMNQLPNVTAASYLNMSPAKYCNLKAAWNIKNRT